MTLNTVNMVNGDPAYDSDNFRNSHGFKELEKSDSLRKPYREEKPLYGIHADHPKGRHTEPFTHFKNIKDFKQDKEHVALKYIKTGIAGAATGVVFGQAWFVVSPIDGFASQKLFATVGERAWSGRAFRLFKQTAPTHAMAGAATFLGYRALCHVLRSNDHKNIRPYFFDHVVATGLIAAAWGASVFRTPRAAMGGLVIGTLTLAPMSYWLFLNGRMGNGNRPANIWYENDVSKEDIARF